LGYTLTTREVEKRSRENLFGTPIFGVKGTYESILRKEEEGREGPHSGAEKGVS